MTTIHHVDKPSDLILKIAFYNKAATTVVIANMKITTTMIKYDKGE